MKFWQLASLTIALSVSVNVNAASYSISSMNVTGGGFIAFNEMGEAVVNPSAGGIYTPFTTIGSNTNLVGGYLGDTTTGFMSATWFDTSVQFYTAASNMGGISVPAGSILGGATPSGTLNDAADTIAMDLSSYFAYWGGADFHQGTGKDDGVTSPVATGAWDSNTGLYSISWISNIDPSVCGPLGATCYAEYTFEGYAVTSVVPVPVISPDIVGSEFLVNTVTSGYQGSASSAMDADGDFVVTWMSLGQDGDDYGIYAQRYNADGSTAGAEFQVNTETSNRQSNPSIAMDADGDFVVCWESDGQDGSGFGVYAQFYNADGSTAGTEFRVNTETSSSQYYPSVAMDADGDFLVTWQSDNQDGSFIGVYAQRYKADGSVAGDEFRVNTETLSDQSYPSVAMDADGDFVVSWESDGQDGDSSGVYAQRFNADGSKVGVEFLVNTETSSFQYRPSVAMDADGDFVVSWASNQDGSDHGIYAQRYNADGSTEGTEFLVNTYIIGRQSDSSVVMDADGDFVVSWESDGLDGDGYGVYAQRYSADGNTVGDEFQVNSFTANSQSASSVAMDADGDFVVSWSSFGQDGSDSGVYAQRFSGAGETVDINLVVNDDTDPITVGNNFVYSLITTNNGTGIAMDVNLSEPFPAGLTFVSDDSASSGWDCLQAAATLECNLPFMAPGASNIINVTVTASASGTSSNTVTASAAQIDANPADNKDTETTVIIGGVSSSGGGGSLSWFAGLLLVPLALTRVLLKKTHTREI